MEYPLENAFGLWKRLEREICCETLHDASMAMDNI